jgi:hypothetical protein
MSGAVDTATCTPAVTGTGSAEATKVKKVQKATPAKVSIREG